MPDYAEEQEESVELDWPNLKDSHEVARYVFGRPTGRPSTDEVAFREYYQQQILFPELLRRAGIHFPVGGLGDRGPGGIGEKRQAQGKGMVGQLLKTIGLSEEMIGSFEETLGMDLGHTTIAVGGIIGALVALWEAEKRIKDFPPLLHLVVLILQGLYDVLAALTLWMGKLSGEELANDYVTGTVDDKINAAETREEVEEILRDPATAWEILSQPWTGLFSGIALWRKIRQAREEGW